MTWTNASGERLGMGWLVRGLLARLPVKSNTIKPGVSRCAAAELAQSLVHDLWVILPPFDFLTSLQPSIRFTVI